MRRILLPLLTFALLAGCATPPTGGSRATPPVATAAKPAPQAPAAPKKPQAETSAEPTKAKHHFPAYSARGKASYYALRHQGRRTASGERVNHSALTAAHRSLPFGSHVRVTNLANDRSVVVRINDRGPYGRGRIIDVSRKAAEQLGMLRSGIASVKIQRID